MYGKSCVACGKRNHVEKVCRSSKSAAVHSVNVEPSVEDFVVDELRCGRPVQWMIALGISGLEIRFKVYTGASCNILLLGIYRRLSSLPLIPGPTVRSYSGYMLKVVGKQVLQVTYKDKHYKLTFVVVDGTDVPLLGLPSCQELNVVEWVDENCHCSESSTTSNGLPQGMEGYMSVFRGLGKLEKQDSIRLRKEHTPIVRSPRHLPLSQY